MPKTPTEIRKELADKGISLAAWARCYGFSEALTYRVMSGHQAKLGQSHRIAVALGLKEGKSGGIETLSFPARNTVLDDPKTDQVREE